jgi:hypothetical protein
VDDLEKLIARCKCGVYVTVNHHRCVYQTAAQWWEDQKLIISQSEAEKIERSDEFRRMIETNIVIEVIFYPENPISFYRVLHHDLNAALAEAVKLIEGDET